MKWEIRELLKLYWVKKSYEKWRVYIVFLVFGMLFIAAGGIMSYSSINYPSSSFDPSYNGFSILRNSTGIANPRMDIDVRTTTSTLFFHYSFLSQLNGTYNFVFRFPFKIIAVQYQSENMSITQTNSGSIITVHHNATISSYSDDQEITGWFTIENTYTSQDKGLFTITIPFGISSNPQEYMDAEEALDVHYFVSGTVISLYVDLPYSAKISSTFPQLSSGVNQWTPPISNATIKTLQWTFDSLRETVIVSYENEYLTRVFENLNFLGGIILGIGVSVTVTVFYDWSKKTWGKTEVYDGE